MNEPPRVRPPSTTSDLVPTRRPRADSQPHPCWCDLIKGDHDLRDHPSGNLDVLRLELATGTNDWKLPVVVRSYDPNGDGEEDQKEDAVILEEHGYTPSVERKWVGNPPAWRLVATYTLPPSSPSTSAAVTPQAIQAAYCPRCGTPRVGGFKFCAACGLAFDALDDPSVDLEPEAHATVRMHRDELLGVAPHVDRPARADAGPGTRSLPAGRWRPRSPAEVRPRSRSRTSRAAPAAPG